MSKTDYVVFKREPGGGDLWQYSGQVESSSPEQACKAAALHADLTGEYAAFPASSWRPELYTVEVKKTVTVGPR